MDEFEELLNDLEEKMEIEGYRDEDHDGGGDEDDDVSADRSLECVTTVPPPFCLNIAFLFICRR